MPRRNTLRIDAPESYYHVYVKGLGKERIFRDEQDYVTFLQLLERYISPHEARDKNGVSYPNFYNKIDLLAYCLMPGYFHLLFFQRYQGMLTAVMRSVMTSYSRYYNMRYKRSGPMFESRFRAVVVSDEAYLPHMTRYIHRLPRLWRDYAYSICRIICNAIPCPGYVPKGFLSISKMRLRMTSLCRITMK